MYKISFPQMGDYGIPAEFLLSHILKAKIIKAPKITSKTIELGTKYSPDFVCTPFKYTLGTMIECLDIGANILIQQGGGCRYGYYHELQEQILKDLNYNFKMINFVTEGKLNIKRINRMLKQIDKKYSKTKAIYYTFITLKMIKYMENINNYIRENIGFEIKKGSFESLKEEMLVEFSKLETFHELKVLYRNYFRRFKNIKIHKPDDRIKIGIIGRPNVGKSSLLNTLLEEEKAIVTDIEGTTRDIVEGKIIINGIVCNIIDTAGIRKTDNIVEQIGVNKSYNIIKKSSLN